MRRSRSHAHAKPWAWHPGCDALELAIRDREVASCLVMAKKLAQNSNWRSDPPVIFARNTVGPSIMPMRLLTMLVGTLPLVTFGSAIAEEPPPRLNDLLKEYRALDLPLPPKESELVR